MVEPKARREPIPAERMYKMEKIITVFPEEGIPQDFESWEDAQEYAEALDCSYEIEEAL